MVMTQRSSRAALDARGWAGDSIDDGMSWREVYDRGIATWPAVQLTYEQLAEHVAELGYGERPPHQATELYLAAACKLGLGTAHHLLEEGYIRPLRAAIGRVVRDEYLIDDVLQELRRRLLVGPAKIACYRGRGPLGGWLRAIALNLATDHLRVENTRRRRTLAQPLAHQSRDVARAFEDPEAYECRTCVPACDAAVRSALSSLASNDRRLLHDYFVVGLSIDLLSLKYLVNRSTIARRIHRITAGIRLSVRRHLAFRYRRESASTLDALASAAACKLEIDASALLAPGAGDRLRGGAP